MTAVPPPDQGAADDRAVARAKTTLRRAVLLRREARSAGQRAADDERRLDHLRAALEARLPDTVAAYLSAGAEPGTLRLVAWLAARDVRVLLPVLTDGGGDPLAEPAWAAYAGPDALRTGRGGILEPTSTPVPASQLPEAEVLVCPALAANRAGDRLGRGGGWYDRALASASQSAPVWVLLNEDEVLPVIPTRSWDRRVDALVTPTGLRECEPPYAG